MQDEIDKKRKELELMLSVEHQMSSRSKYELIRRIMDVLEESIEDDNKHDDD